MKTQHALIAPINYLHLIPDESNYHLILAHLLKNERYCAFYREKYERGDFIILDNGAFENGTPMSINEIKQLVNKHLQFTPDVVVLPDYPGENHLKTVRAVEQTLNLSDLYIGWPEDNRPDNVRKSTNAGGWDPLTQVSPQHRVPSWMAVPQSHRGDWQGWVDGYKILSDFSLVKWIGLSILGIPNAFCTFTGTEDVATNRIFAITYLKRRGLWNEYKKHHALGLSQPREYHWLNLTGGIDGNDSSSAIWHGMHNILYDNSWGGLKDGKIKVPVDFEMKYEELGAESIATIKCNINFFTQTLI